MTLSLSGVACERNDVTRCLFARQNPIQGDGILMLVDSQYAGRPEQTLF